MGEICPVELSNVNVAVSVADPNRSPPPSIYCLDNVYTVPAAGLEYLLLHVNLRYAAPHDLPVWVGPDTFYAMDESGYQIHGDWIYTPTQSDRVWLSNKILPGAELEGWVPVTITAGTESPVIVFDPDTYTSGSSGENLRYLGVK